LKPRKARMDSPSINKDVFYFNSYILESQKILRRLAGELQLPRDPERLMRKELEAVRNAANFWWAKAIEERQNEANREARTKRAAESKAVKVGTKPVRSAPARRRPKAGVL
jgi:hypothetical protein